MYKRLISLVAPLVVAIMSLALGWFAHAAAPLAAQAISVDGRATLFDPVAPAAPGALTSTARLTYQGRLTDGSGAPINSAIAVTFKIYTGTPTFTPTVAIWTSAVRTITPTNGLFTVYLGDGADPNLYINLLAQAAFIGVKVGVDSEMTPRQALNTVVGHGFDYPGVIGSSLSGAGVIGHSDSLFGVAGTSRSGYGVEGDSTSNIGVIGLSTSNVAVYGNSTSGSGVVGYTGALTGSGVMAQGAGPTGIALSLQNGGIQVQNAGIGASTPVFVHVADSSNITLTNQTIINHPHANSNPSAILIVTPVNNYSNVPSTNNVHPVGVFWRSDINRWVIYNVDNGAMLDNTRFNVLVVNP